MYDDWCLACVACALILYTMMMHCPIACLGFIDELYLSVICEFFDEFFNYLYSCCCCDTYRLFLR